MHYVQSAWPGSRHLSLNALFLILWMMVYKPSLARKLRDLPASLSAWSPPVSPHQFRSALTA